LIKIAHNARRQRSATGAPPREVAVDDPLAVATTERADVLTATEIRRFLALNQRAALIMRELEGRSYVEIAI
jgi:DNA-directed RNA polymerase specialized sigma24 family protein